VCQERKVTVGQLSDKLREGLVLYMRFEEAAWDGTANEVRDLSPYSNHGTAKNSLTTATGGILDRCASLTAASFHYITIADSPTLSFGDGSSDVPFSMRVWIKPTAVVGWQPLLTKSPDIDTNREILWSLNGSGIYCALYDRNGANRIARTKASGVITASVQNHCVMTYNGTGVSTGIKLFVNKVQVDNANDDLGSYAAMEDTNSPVELGREEIGPDLHYGGKMDEFAIWRRELSPDEIKEDYNNGKARIIHGLGNYTNRSTLLKVPARNIRS
jgi:hypothetical protein